MLSLCRWCDTRCTDSELASLQGELKAAMQVLDVSVEDGLTPHVTVFAAVLSAIFHLPGLEDGQRVQRGFEVAKKMERLGVQVMCCLCPLLETQSSVWKLGALMPV